VNADYPGSGMLSFTIYPLEVASSWDFAKTTIWNCDKKTGERLSQIEWTRNGEDGLRVGPFADWTVLDVETR